MLEMTITIHGKEQGDLESSVEEVHRLIARGFTSGSNRNDSGEFYFSTTGEAEPELSVEVSD